MVGYISRKRYARAESDAIYTYNQSDFFSPLIIYNCISTKQEIDQTRGSVLLAKEVTSYTYVASYYQ